MSGTETQELRDDITEIKGDVKEMRKDVSSLAIQLAGNYITRKEFEQYKKDHITSLRWWAGFVITGGGVLVAVVNAIFAILHKGG